MDVDGNTDKLRKLKRRGGVQICTTDLIPMFPQYSPDLNGIIEKAWRFLDTRVKARAAEIRGEADMKRVILEEWDALAFDNSQERLGWKGINYWADKFKELCEAVVEERGFDSKYMR